MRFIHGIKIGGLQQKIFNMMLIFIIALVAVFVSVSVFQQKSLSQVVEKASEEQQASISAVSEETMQTTVSATMLRTTALQAYIANDLFSDVRSDVMTLHSFATQLFEHSEAFSQHPFYPPDRANDGVPSVQMQHEAGVDPASSEALGLAANMSEIMLSMFESSDKLNSCFVATTDGCILFVDDRAGAYFDENGEVYDFDVRSRPWYKQAVEAGGLIFTGVELDAFTDISGLVCAAPVYKDGRLVAVVGADIFLTAISDYVRDTANYGGFLCVVNEDGQILFSPNTEGTFKPEVSAESPDLRQSENKELAAFVKEALKGRTGLETITVDGIEYYLAGAPMETVGWAVISVIDKAITHQPTAAMLQSYDEINEDSLETFRESTSGATRTLIILTVAIILLAAVSALFVASRVVKPIEHMTRRINELSGEDSVFEMDKVYKTNDEIEVLAESFASISAKTKDYIKQITEITAEKERVGAELTLATRIQADMLPNIFPAFPDRPDFDVYASMAPAKEVGGDFYDFFLIDEDHLGLVIADVSGKGIPAALFMMVSKILVQNYAMTGRSPKEVLESVNAQICSNNREDMFVTVWFGVLDLTNGRLTAANAGHEYPVLKKPDGSFELFKDKHGFVIGGMETAKYTEYEIQMDPGAKLFLYTDGVAEATDSASELFGTERMTEALRRAENGTPQEILGSVSEAVELFVGDAPQFDDLTMLCVHYIGKKEDSSVNDSKEMTVEATVENIESVTDFVNAELEALDCPMKAQMQIDVAIDELFGNIAQYAYDPETGPATVRVEVENDPLAVVITFIDNGKPYDPLAAQDPDVTLSAEEREIGGLGVFLVKKTMDDVSYEYRDGKNILKIKKHI